MYSRHRAKMFLKYIAEVQRDATRQLIQQCRFFSVMADGSTDRSIAEQESIYIRLVIEGEPINLFVGLQELASGDSSGVLLAVDTALQNKAGISLDMQRNMMVNVNLDGASVNMGVYNGLAACLQDRNGPHVTCTNCINHRLELTILEVRKDEPYVNTFETVVKSIFSFYHYSPKLRCFKTNYILPL